MRVALGRLFADDVDEADQEIVELTTSKGNVLRSVPIIREGNSIHTEDGFKPDIILINNDLTAGAPEIICGLEQAIVPPTGLGWYRRRKSIYFAAYDKIATEFAKDFNFDPWTISTFSHRCGVVNFKERKGLECVAIGVEKTIHRLKEKYAEYNINDEPYVYIKADSGTYGMGIMTAKSGEEVFAMNKKLRKKMNVIKEGTANTEVIIQEGVPTIDSYNNEIAEPTIYLFDGKAVGGFWRINDSRDIYKNLNASGMSFQPIEADFSNILYDKTADKAMAVRSVIAQLSSLAASREQYPLPSPCE